jgi:hypothetical protein
MRQLDLRLVVKISLQYFVFWLFQVLVVIWIGYPGILCITPAAWLLSIVVGIECVKKSSSPITSQRLVEALISGGIYGLLLGILFFVGVSTQFSIQASEQKSMVWVSIGMVVSSILVSAVAAYSSGWVVEMRKKMDN